MTREEFIAGYCERSRVSWDWLSQRRKAIPCYCGEQGCKGWAMVPLSRPDCWSFAMEAAAKYVETYAIQMASGDLIDDENPIRALPLPEPPK